MGQLSNTLLFRLMSSALLVYAILLPALFYGLVVVVRGSHADIFINQVRTNGQLFADEFQRPGVLQSPKRSADLLDSIVLSGYVQYAELIRGDDSFKSPFSIEIEPGTFAEDFNFGDHDDAIYFLSKSLSAENGKNVILRLGYDEQPTLDSIAEAQAGVTAVLTVFLLVSLLLLTILAIRLVRPIRELQKASRIISSGSYADKLEVHSSVKELNDLARDLESMRSELVGVNSRLRDEIGERKTGEKERRELEAQLRQSQKLQSVGTLAGGVAHEFNNILQPMILFTELVLDDLPKGTESREDLERILTGARRAKELVQKLLAFSRPSGEGVRIEVDLAELVATEMEMLDAVIPANILITKEYPSGPAMIMANNFQVGQVLVNLCNNASLAIGSNAGEMTVSVTEARLGATMARRHSNLKPGLYYRLTVTDNGEGMSDEGLERVFEPFYTTREVGEGTGLGMSVAHGIVMRHEGEIDIQSEAGKGTTVDVYFPAAGERNYE
jgi:signal transduction histidine kinase